ncbi:general transcription factor IIH subunit 3-like isoform X2 [Drosophila obscura]|uniref:general transcription factor IIH subunit 3-like isoform X2 n=1 Tax=Drosophila obscura TaxID=7282 RepID=UPI001BB2C894|nr:general transcription factor IIH subunit 3-like isoform X2 [Drosophila obscura]
MEAEPLTNLDVATTPMASSKIETQNESNIEKTEADADAVSLNAMDDNRRFFKMHTGDLAPEDVHILVLILDIDYGQSYIQSGKVDMALNMVDAAMVLANGHLLQRPRNEVGVIACSRNIVMLAHSIDIPLTSYDYQLDTIKTMEYDVSRKVEEELLREFAIVEKLSEEDDKSSLIAESLGLALAYIQKRRRQIPDIYTGRRVQGRILHPSYDNLILEALETNVTINVCAIKVEKQKPLQRATEVTDGLYLCTNETFSLPGSLVDHYLYPSYLVKAPKPHITTPARCACHGFDNKIGFVCAKCNLVLCKHSPYCDDCREAKAPTGTGEIKCKDSNSTGIVFWTKEKPKPVLHTLESHIARRIQSNDSEIPIGRRIHSIVRITNATDADIHLAMCGFF